MALLDIATPQPSLRISYPTLYHGTHTYGWEKRLASSWKSFRISEKAKNLNQGCTMMQWSGLVIRAVHETKFSSIQRADGKNKYLNSQLSGDLQTSSHQSESGEETEVDEKEMLRRKKISKANKGNTPWNKGRKHTPETLRRIKERTKIAMQAHKVKRKSADFGHDQSEKTRIKIGAGVRIGWDKRREKLKLQETCLYEWQNLIAEASRRGYDDQVELQWNSYEIIHEQMTCEWLEKKKKKKKSSTPKGNRKAPKTLEQRRKVSAAISAKWSDPAYRERVYSGLSKRREMLIKLRNSMEK